jgi:uncharacterized protein
MDLSIDWNLVSEDLNGNGFAHLKNVLSPNECQELQTFYPDNQNFRSVINMQRYRFGRGEYKYFKYPLPLLLQEAREHFYSKLSPIANSWMQNLGVEIKYPESHEEFIQTCHSRNQLRPTPLILRYEAGDYNTLHQDLYGDVYFPFQIVFVLTEPEVDHTGGELVFLEQLPRAQSRAEVLSPGQGDAVIFTTNFRPVKGTRGYYRAKMKHGISAVKSGVRFALGIIFHDAA